MEKNNSVSFSLIELTNSFWMSKKEASVSFDSYLLSDTLLVEDLKKQR